MSQTSAAVTQSRSLGVVDASNVTVSIKGHDAEVVQEVSLTVSAGEVVGIVGESGSGKTTLGLALIGHVRRGLGVAGGSVSFEGMDILRLPDKRLRPLRGSQLAYVPQDPGVALDPARRVGPQLTDSLTSHGRTSAQARDRIDELLPEVGLDSFPDLLERYPHQLSGGQLQRVVIAMAFACHPSLIVLDEPTTGLDVTTQRVVLDTLARMCADSHVGAVYISHDVAVVSQVAHRIAVMYAGRLVELGATDEVLGATLHPYTKGLLAAVPSMIGDAEMKGIRGAPPRPGRRPAGCAFAPRCALRVAECDSAVPAMRQLGPSTHTVRCIRAGEGTDRMPASRAVIGEASSGPPARLTAGNRDTEAKHVLEAHQLSAAYGRNQVLREISLRLDPGRCLAVVGESGSGKTTLARCLVGLHADWTGTLRCADTELHRTVRGRSRTDLRRMQYVFQNPYASLNPRRTVGALLAQPLRHFFNYTASELRHRVSQAAENVSLPLEMVSRYPEQLSGGERQRVAIARALIVSPEVLICDEVTSALDVSVQAAVVAMLMRVMEEQQMAMVFITHDLALARSIAHEVMVLHHGRCVDAGPLEQVLTQPQDEYTIRLMDDVPKIAPATGDRAGFGQRV